MSSQLYQNQALQQQLIDIVQIQGGPEKARWNYIARQLFQNFGYHVLPGRLEEQYYSITCQQQESYSIYQQCIVLRTFIEQKYNLAETKKCIMLLDKKKYGQLYTCRRKFYGCLSSIIIKGLTQLINIFILRKSHYKLKLQDFSLVPFKIFLQFSQFSGNEIPILYKELAKKLEAALLIFMDNLEMDQKRMYGLLKTVMKRRDVLYILEVIFYIHELRQIFLDRYTNDDQLIGHPFLCKTISECKSNKLYMNVIENDWRQKLNLYQQSFDICQQNENSSVLVKFVNNKLQLVEQFPIFKNHHEIQKVVQKKNQPQVKYVRGLIKKQKDPQYRSKLTKIFDVAEQKFDQESEKKNSIKNEKIRSLFRQLYKESFNDDEENNQ